MDGIGANVEVTHLDEQVSRFNGPMAITCDKVGTGCELDASFSDGALAGRPLSRRRRRAQGRLADRARRAHVRRRRRRRRRGARDHHHDDARPAPRRRARRCSTSVLSRATAYADSYATRAVSTVSEERYVQAIVDSPLIDRAEALSWRERPEESRKRTPGVAARRQIAAEMLMVKSDGGFLVPYRDVAAVDGRPVKDRDTRAMQLFTSGGVPSTATLRKITEEGARYNLGNVRRTVNIPTMALLVLHPKHVGRFDFELAGKRARRRRRHDGGAVQREADADLHPHRPRRRRVLERAPVGGGRRQRAPVGLPRRGARQRHPHPRRSDLPRRAVARAAAAGRDARDLHQRARRSPALDRGPRHLPELPRLHRDDVGRRGRRRSARQLPHVR